MTTASALVTACAPSRRRKGRPAQARLYGRSGSGTALQNDGTRPAQGVPACEKGPQAASLQADD